MGTRGRCSRKSSPDSPAVAPAGRRGVWALIAARIATGIAMASTLGGAIVAPRRASAGPLDAFSQTEATSALRQALDKGADGAVSLLGRPGGFLDNPAVRIPLPDGLRQAEKLLRLAGRGAEVDALITAMNRAAEAAVPEAKQLLGAAIRSMSVGDAKAILTGGNDSVTRFFADRTRGSLTERFLPIVTSQVGRLGLSQRYNALAAQGEKLGLVRRDAASVERYVTGKALDGLYRMIGEQERAIRADPLRAGGALIGKVFGALR